MSATKVSADRLREARVYLGFSPDDVATVIECERSRFDDIEAGRQQITGEELRKLSRLYRRPVEWLCGETTFQPSPDLLRQVEHLGEGDREAVLDFAEFLQGAGPALKPSREGLALKFRRQPGQVPPDHPDAVKPVGWGEHPRDCNCGDCP